MKRGGAGGTAAVGCALLALALLATIAPPASALHVTVGKASSECFSVEADKGKHGISLNYEALRGVADDLEAELRDGADAVVYRNEGSGGRYAGEIGAGGTHTVCFRNERAPVGDVVVGFSFHADDPSHEVLSNADATKIKQVQELEDLVYDLSVNLDTVKDTQAYMKAISEHHNQLITRTHSSIMWWTCAEAVVLTAVALTQISFLRRTLEVRRVL